MAEVVREVPAELKSLVRIVMRAFYSDLHVIVMDSLIHHPCMKEDELLEMLGFKRQHLGPIIKTLFQDKFVRVYNVPYVSVTGRQCCERRYYISYSAFVNVVKYKLENIRRKIHADERFSANRASFNCPACLRQYTDLDVGSLFDPHTQLLLCSYCTTEVDDVKVDTADAAHALMVMFNEQTERIMSLLTNVERLKLSDEILMPQLTHDSNAAAVGGSSRDGSFGATESRVTISVNSETTNTPDTAPVKQVPIWLTQSSVDEVDTTQDVSRDSSDDISAPAETSRDSRAADIIQALLSCEKKPPAAAALSSVDEGIDSEDELETVEQTGHSTDVETMETGEMEESDEDEDLFVVCVGDMKFAVNEVPGEYINKMTAEEKQEYIQLARRYYQQFL